MNMNETLYRQLAHMPEAKLMEVLKFIEFLNYKEKYQAGGDKIRRYDFSGLSGRLQWQGNALAEQKRLRNDW